MVYDNTFGCFNILGIPISPYTSQEDFTRLVSTKRFPCVTVGTQFGSSMIFPEPVLVDDCICRCAVQFHKDGELSGIMLRPCVLDEHGQCVTDSKANDLAATTVMNGLRTLCHDDQVQYDFGWGCIAESTLWIKSAEKDAASVNCILALYFTKGNSGLIKPLTFWWSRYEENILIGGPKT